MSDPEPTTRPVPGDAIFYGVVGEYVRAVAPFTEADLVAVLAHLLVMLGNLFGRGPYQVIDGKRHAVNLYLLVVGVTSQSRKGTALARALELLKLIASEYVMQNCAGGLSSGEGLIYHVRDAVRHEKDGEYVVTDPGIDDKRLLCIENSRSRARG